MPNPNPQVTIDQFAAEIRKKHPGDYDKWKNDELVSSWVAAYPQDKDRVLPREPAMTTGKEAPYNARFPKLGASGYEWVDRLTSMLPAAGMTAGGMAGAAAGVGAGGPPAIVTGPVGGGLGGMAGTALERLVNRGFYKNAYDDEDKGDRNAEYIKNTAMGAGSELVTRAGMGAIGHLIQPYEKAAVTIKAANAGQGIRLTPGEAGNRPLLKMVETLVPHLPGGVGTMEKFRAAQEGDVSRTFDQVLDSISKRKLDKEATGKLVKKAIETDVAKSNANFAEPKQLLGLPENATADDIRKALKEQAAAFKEKNINVTNSAAGRKFNEAINYWKDKNVDMLGKVMDKNPSVITRYVEKLPIEDLRSLRSVLTPEVQQHVSRNVAESILADSIDSQTDLPSAKIIADRLKNLGGPGRGRLILGGPGYDNMLEASRLFNKINASSSAGLVGRMHVSRLMLGVGSAVAALLVSGGFDKTALALASEPMIARVIAEGLTNPRFTVATMKILRNAAATAVRLTPAAIDAATYTSPAKSAPTQP